MQLSFPSLDIGFAEVRGRVYPMVGLHRGAVIEANFGADLEMFPFKHPEGRDMVYDMRYLIACGHCKALFNK